METERKLLLEALNDEFIQSYLIYILKNDYPENPKSTEASAEARKKGNDLFLKHKRHDPELHKAIFSHFCESIALAPMESPELAMAYGNRSYLLLHMHKYEECIQDIDRALEIPIPDVLKSKLLCRKAECKKRLGSFSTSDILKMAQDVAETVDGQDKIKLLEMIDAVKALAVGTKKEGLSKSDQKSKADCNLAITDDYSSCISIEYSEKYGRHLVAAKDYKPGDIIFVEKMHASAFVDGFSLLGCHHCLKHVWSSIPCNYCSWAMYCSESCREEAWNEYHDIECSTISQLKQWLHLASKSAVLPLRILIMGIKETGGIANLKKEIELLNQCADNSSRYFFKNGQFATKSILNACSLASSLDPPDIFTKCANTVPFILISLTKYSKLKDDFNFEQAEDLEMMNEDIMFLGSLLIKLVAVLNVNIFAARHDNALKFKSEMLNEEFTMIEQFDVKQCLGTLFSLLNHSCFPSAVWCCTESNKIVVYALQPIKKNSQIFIQYYYGFENEFQSVRQAYFREKYKFTCECQACVEDWPPIMKIAVGDDEEMKADLAKDIDTEKHSNCKKDQQEIEVVLQEGRQVDKLHVAKMSALITRAMHWRQPSFMFCDLMTLLKQVFKSIYAPEPLVFDKCN